MLNAATPILVDTQSISRQRLVRKGKRLEYFTVLYNSLEGIISIIAGIMAGSVSLIGFGLDSVIEVTSGAALIWRLHHDGDTLRRERNERIALRVVGASFLALAVYVAFESLSSLIHHEAPERSILGIVIASVSLVVMPILSREKRKVAIGINSGAMNADARQTDFCTYLSAILLGGLICNALLGWWWADPIAALVMVPIIGKEGIEAAKGESCGCGETCH